MSRTRAAAFGFALLAAAALPAAAQKPGEVALSGHVLTEPAVQSAGRATVLLFDDLNIPASSMEWARKAATAYVASAPPGAAWAVLTTSGAPSLPLSPDRAAIAATIAKITSHAEALGSTSAVQATTAHHSTHAGGNADEALQNHSAHSIDTLSSAVAYAAALPGPPVLLVVSTGFPVDFPANGTNLNDEVGRMTAAAAASGVLVNAVDPASMDPTLPDWQLQEGVLNSLTHAAGGTLVDNRNQLASAFEHLASSPALSTAGDKLRQALGGAKLDEIPVEVAPARWNPTKDAPTGTHLVVLVSPKGLAFDKQQGRSRQHLRVVAVLTDAQGKWIAAREGRILLNLSDATLRRLDQDNIKAALELPAPPGAYHIVIIIQELDGGRTTALAANLAVR